MGKLLKPPACANCPINHVTGTHYVPPQIIPASSILLVGETVNEHEVENGKGFTGPAGAWLNSMLYQANIKRADCSTASVIACQCPGGVYPGDGKWKATSREAARAAIQYCSEQYLQKALRVKQWKKIFAIGEGPLQVLTNKRGVLVWRGSPLPLAGKPEAIRVVPTLQPKDLARDPKYVSVAINDLRKGFKVPPENYELYSYAEHLRGISARKFAFDLEWDYNGDISLCGITDKYFNCYVAGWTADTARAAREVFERATDLIGHNIIGADTVMFKRLGWNITAKMHDTMLKQHLLQPDYKHDLGFVASVYTNKAFWKGKGTEEEDEYGQLVDAKVQWKTWDLPGAVPRELGGYGGCRTADEAYRLYNARDTDASFQINESLDPQLARWGLDRVYWNVSVPIAFICRDIVEPGVKLDRSAMREMRSTLSGEIEKLEKTLPEGLRPYEVAVTKQIPAPAGTYKLQTKSCKGTKKAPHEPWLVTWSSPGDPQGCPYCEKLLKPNKWTEVKTLKVPGTDRVVPWNSSTQVTAYAAKHGLKARWDRKRGSASADSLARKGWSKTHPEFRIIDKLKELGTLRSNFAKDSLQSEERMYFNLLVHGTAEGRFSSAGKRKGIDLNIQNQPAAFKHIYIPDTPDDCFIELDYSGGENWLTAWLAQDTQRLERLRQDDYSEHLHLAQLLFEMPSGTGKKDAKSWCRTCKIRVPTGADGNPSTCTGCGRTGQDLYDVAKHVNHGGNYGMTHIKQKEYCDALECYFTEAEHKTFIALREGMNPGTTVWQRATIEAAKQQGWLRNPFGRMRWFSSRNVGTQALAFLPASTLADIIIRAMIGHYPSRFPKECLELGLKVTGDLLPGWRIAMQIHDSLVLHGPRATRDEQAARSAAIMQQSWAELQEFSLSVGISGGEAGGSWGSLKSLAI